MVTVKLMVTRAISFTVIVLWPLQAVQLQEDSDEFGNGFYTTALAHDCTLSKGIGEVFCEPERHSVALPNVTDPFLLHIHILDVFQQDLHSTVIDSSQVSG